MTYEVAGFIDRPIACATGFNVVTRGKNVVMFAPTTY